jgi:hypothetical protein
MCVIERGRTFGAIAALFADVARNGDRVVWMDGCAADYQAYTRAAHNVQPARCCIVATCAPGSRTLLSTRCASSDVPRHPISTPIGSRFSNSVGVGMISPDLDAELDPWLLAIAMVLTIAAKATTPPRGAMVPHGVRRWSMIERGFAVSCGTRGRVCGARGRCAVRGCDGA